MNFQLSGKRALVTGSNSGIGRGVATMLAGEDASVIIHGRDVERCRAIAGEISAAGGIAKAVSGDLDTDAGASDVAKAAQDAWGGIDILINNAGGRLVSDAPISWFSMSPEAWTQTFNRNVTSAVRLIHHLVEPMKKLGWGRIIQISSISAQSTSGGVADYAAAKSAVGNLTLSLAKTLGNTGITVNTISPGLIHVAVADQWLQSIAQQQGLGSIGEAKAWVLENTLKQTVNRMGKPEDIAFAACFLCSPLADFINGANIRVDGGASPAVN